MISSSSLVNVEKRVLKSDDNNDTKRSRIYKIIYSNENIENWNIFRYINIINRCEYICAYQTNNIVTGYIRFKNSISVNSMKNTFNMHDITIEKERSNDNYYKFQSQSCANKIEYGKPKLAIDKIKYSEKEIELISHIKKQQNIIDIQENKIALIKNKIAKTKSYDKGFNLQSYFNNYCQKPIDIFTFINNIVFTTNDILLCEKNGYINTIISIFVNAYTNMNQQTRPILCTDIKRKTFHIYYNNIWVNDITKEITNDAINKLSNIYYDKVCEYYSNTNNIIRKVDNNKKIINEISKTAYINKISATINN
jgi:hypothetical protein